MYGSRAASGYKLATVKNKNKAAGGETTNSKALAVHKQVTVGAFLWISITCSRQGTVSAFISALFLARDTDSARSCTVCVDAPQTLNMSCVAPPQTLNVSCVAAPQTLNVICVEKENSFY